MNGDTTTAHDTPCDICQCDHCKRSRWMHALRDSPLWEYLMTRSGSSELFWKRLADIAPP